jgi:ubiquinone/menaquinone biosynthesis C-methylase UbiE
VSWTYADVDRSEDPAGAAAWMDTMASWSAVRACKDRTVELLAGRRPVVDVGCGVGDEVRALGGIGVDSSFTMLREACGRGGVFARGDIHALPFGTATLDGVRTERVLQHVADPDAALVEIARVLRAGGSPVLAEPDQATLAIEGTDPELTPAIVRFRQRSVRNGFLAGELADRLVRLGFTEVQREAFTIEITDPGLAFGLPTWPAMLVERGEWTAADARRFESSLASEDFSYRFDCVVTWGTR